MAGVAGEEIEMVYAIFTLDGELRSVDYEGCACPPVECEPLEQAQAEAALDRFAALGGDPPIDVRYEPAEPVEVPPEALAGPRLPWWQLDTARRLAGRHSHQWASALEAETGGERLSAARRALARLRDEGDEIPFALIAECSAALGYGPCGGIGTPHLEREGGDVVHETGTGRLRWRVRRDGSGTVEVWRPHPLVAALRAPDDETIEHAAERGRLLAVLGPAAELVAGREQSAYEIARWAEAQVEPVCVLRLTVAGPAGDYTIEAPAGLAHVHVRHVQAIEGALGSLACWVDSPDVRALYEGCPDYADWVGGRRETHREYLATGREPWGAYQWHWAAGPCPEAAAA
jgi:hypothetical protein